MFNFIKRHKALSLLLFLNVVAVLIAILIIVIHNSKTATVDIMVTPYDAVVELNGARYENMRSHNIVPGDYHVKISMEGMQTKEYDFSIERDGFVRIWNYLLDANGGFDYYLIHPDDEAILENIVNENDKAAQKFITEYKQKIAIVNVLPVVFDAYTDNFSHYTRYNIKIDDSRDDCSKIACLIIEDNTGGNEQAAIGKIKELGYNPDDYEIEYEFVPIFGSEINND